ncbi:hypothetical protein B0H34DRAFT_675247 [Crassisporium funariophilum]|nr:hypothetical protein B0H34DRAFT_675247 [Crassisporium funariophilum]
MDRRTFSLATVSLYFLAALSFFIEGASAVHEAHVVVRQASPTIPATITPTPILFFDSVPQPTSCTPVALSWFYTGPSGALNLVITNVGVAQDDPPPPPSSTTKPPNTFTNGNVPRAIPSGANLNEPSDISVTIARNVDPFSLGITWPSVSVPQGWYILNGSMPSQSFTQTSAPLFVRTGSDTSCLSQIVSSTTTGTGPTGSPTSTSVIDPVSGAAGPSANHATIIGVSIGACALIAAVLAAWFCLHKRARVSPVLGVAGDTKSLAHRWNGLSSTDSRGATAVHNSHAAGARYASGRSPRSHTHSQADSVATMLGASGSQDAFEKSSTYQKGNGFGDSTNAVALAALPVLQHQPASKARGPPTVSRTYSASSTASNAYSVAMHEFPAGNGGPPRRRPSVPDSVPSRRSIDSTTYPPSSPITPLTMRNSTQFSAAGGLAAADMSRSHSLSTSNTHQTSSTSTAHGSGTSTSHQQASTYPMAMEAPRPIVTSNNASSHEAKQANRQSLGRKRKPVPAYSPDDEPMSPLSPASPIVAPPLPSSTPPIGEYGNGTGNGNGAHYATRGQEQPDLVHKSSFGPGGVEGRPLHYLIPDMPMPLKS